MTEKGAYGEPWYTDGIWVKFPAEYEQRIVACVTALDGYDPEKLGTFLEACRGLEGMRPYLTEIWSVGPQGGPLTDYWNAYDALMWKVRDD